MLQRPKTYLISSLIILPLILMGCGSPVKEKLLLPTLRDQNIHPGPWSQYLKKKLFQPPEDFINLGIKILGEENKNLNSITVTDLGVGAGHNIKEFLERGATAYAYDADSEAAQIIRSHFKDFINQKKLHFDQQYFENIHTLSKSDMVIAWLSLSFMDKNNFMEFWPKIIGTLNPGGLFIGTFFGKNHYLKRGPKSPKIHRLTRPEILILFKDFQILYLFEELEYDKKSSTSWKEPQYDHVYKIIARKLKT